MGAEATSLRYTRFLKARLQASHEPWFAVEILLVARKYQSKTGFRILRIDKRSLIKRGYARIFYALGQQGRNSPDYKVNYSDDQWLINSPMNFSWP